MKKSTLSLPFILAMSALLLLGGCNFSKNNGDTKQATQQDQSMSEKDSMENKKDSKSAPAMEAKEDTQMKSAGEYVNYTQSHYQEVLGKKPIALFFHASWCPTCLGMEKDIKAHLSSIPAGTEIIQVDYDAEIALKKEYGITSQSLVVIIDSDGKAVETLAAPSFDDIENALSSL